MLRAQIVYNDAPPFTDEAKLKVILEEANGIKKTMEQAGFTHSRYDILEVGPDLYLLPDGHLNVYLWQDTTWKKITKKEQFGYNFGAKKFIYNNQIYSYGGYGFWRRHGDLIRFDVQKEEWEILPFTQHMKGGLANFNGKGLCVYGPQSYYIDMEREKIYLIRQYLAPYKGNNTYDAFTREMDGYTINNEKQMLIDLGADQIYKTDIAFFLLERDEKNRKKNALHIQGTNVAVYDSTYTTIRRYRVPSLMENFSLTDQVDNSSNSLIYLTAGMALILITLLSWQIALSRKIKIKSVSVKSTPDNYASIFEALLSADRQLLSSEELDVLFGLTEVISPDSQRFKRAQLIKEINQLHHAKTNQPLILRKPDPNDGRKYVYEIKHTL